MVEYAISQLAIMNSTNIYEIQERVKRSLKMENVRTIINELILVKNQLLYDAKSGREKYRTLDDFIDKCAYIATWLYKDSNNLFNSFIDTMEHELDELYKNKNNK